ncbi:MAG: hypothetical protein RL358_98 [Pseudomonadota bacterium]|jgi:hypothetical protein
MRILIFCLLSLFTLPSHAESGIAVIANLEGDLGKLTRKQIVDIYMGKLTVLASGTFPQPVDYQGDPEIRDRFYRLMTGKSLAQINAYWARMSFTGQANRCRLLSDQKAMVRAIGKNQDALGYVNQNEAGASVKTIMIVE